MLAAARYPSMQRQVHLYLGCFMEFSCYRTGEEYVKLELAASATSKTS